MRSCASFCEFISPFNGRLLLTLLTEEWSHWGQTAPLISGRVTDGWLLPGSLFSPGQRKQRTGIPSTEADKTTHSGLIDWCLSASSVGWGQNKQWHLNIRCRIGTVTGYRQCVHLRYHITYLADKIYTTRPQICSSALLFAYFTMTNLVKKCL